MDLRQIVKGGYCVGCGVCSAVDPSIQMAQDRYGRYQANLPAEQWNDAKAQKTCPFSDEGRNEDSLATALFGESCRRDPAIGFYQGLYSGHVTKDAYREHGTSGGVVSWLCAEWLRKGMADHVIHVRPCSRSKTGKLFSYAISSSQSDIADGAKSRYYPVEMSSVLREMKKRPGRYVVVGLPCFIKAVRKMGDIDADIRNRVVLSVGLVCGHLKSSAFADCLGWQVGIPPGALSRVDFRVKLPDRSADDYGVTLYGADKVVTKPARDFLGSNWGHNFFRYSACNYCDDVFAETADVVVGDAWLGEYDSDYRGNCVVVVRSNQVVDLIERSIEKGDVSFREETLDLIKASQAGALRDRREGLAYRLYLKHRKRKPAPQKRVVPAKNAVTFSRRQVYRMRICMQRASHSYWIRAVERQRFVVFSRRMLILTKINTLLYYHSSRYVSRGMRAVAKRMRACIWLQRGIESLGEQ